MKFTVDISIINHDNGEISESYIEAESHIDALIIALEKHNIQLSWKQTGRRNNCYIYRSNCCLGQAWVNFQ